MAQAFKAASWRRLVQLFGAVALCSVILAGCSTTPSPVPTGGKRVGVLSLLGDQLQVVGTGADGAGPTHRLVDIGAWRIDEHVEQHARQAIRDHGRFTVVDVGIDSEVSRRIYADCDIRCITRAPEVRIDVLARSLAHWRRDNGLDRLVVFVRSDNSHALLGPLATSAAGVGLGIAPGTAGGKSATVFTYVEVMVIEAETAEVVATSGFFNNGFVDAAVPVADGQPWPTQGYELFERTIRRQLEDGADAVLEQLGLFEPATASR